MDLGPETIAVLLDTLLEEAVEALATEPAAEAPERKYIAHSEPAMDCEQLTTHLVRVVPKPLDPRQEGCAIIHVATLAVVLFRCVTALDDEGIPDATTLNSENRQLVVDGWALWKHLTRQTVTGIWPDGIACTKVKWGNLEPKPPLGNLAGWRIAADITLT